MIFRTNFDRSYLSLYKTIIELYQKLGYKGQFKITDKATDIGGNILEELMALYTTDDVDWDIVYKIYKLLLYNKNMEFITQEDMQL